MTQAPQGIAFLCPVCNHPCLISAEGEGVRMARCCNHECRGQKVTSAQGERWEPWFGAAAWATPARLQVR